MTTGSAPPSALAAAMAERRVTTPAGGLRISAVLLTFSVNVGAMSGPGELVDALWVYLRDATTNTTSVNSDKATFLFIVMLQPGWLEASCSCQGIEIGDPHFFVGEPLTDYWFFLWALFGVEFGPSTIEERRSVAMRFRGLSAVRRHQSFVLPRTLSASLV